MRTGRRGVALVIALLALVALGGILAASVFPAIEGQRAGEQSARLELLAGAAELGIARGVAALDPGFLRASAAPGPILSEDTLLGVPFRALVRTEVTRSPAGVLWVGSVATTPGIPGERRARHYLLEELLPSFPSGVALLTRTEPSVSGGFTLEGADVTPSGWLDCAPPSGGGTAVQLSSDTVAMRRFGADSLESLLAAARLLSPDSAAGTLPSAPVLLASAGLVLGPGEGEGILVASSSLAVRGPFVFNGVVIARGPLTLGSGVRINGLVISAGESVTLEGSGSVQRSQCAVSRVARRLARATSHGSWRWGISY